jgi:Flp pilus assembly protein TadD
MNRTILKLAASALIIGTVGAATATEVTPKMLKAAEQAADNALAALKKSQMKDAVRYAERAVAYNPSSAGHRALLGQAYLHSGRFNSAETAFTDALRLQPDHGRAALGLALTEIALGKNERAIAALDTARGRVPDADVGLGLALAGDNAAALAMLEPAARSADANAKVRQNLALTYALAGRWAEARTTAAQDIAPDQVDPRMVEWARFARPRGSNEQVATLLGVTPVIDSGMPSQLALLEAMPAAEPVALAAAEPQPVAAEPIPAPTPAAEVASVPEPAAPASLIRPVDVPLPVLAPAAAPLKTVKAAKAYLVSASAVDASKPAYVKPVAAKPVLVANTAARRGNFVVQLGAFSSQDRLERGWNSSVSKVSWLKGYTPVSTSFKSPADGRSLHRLAISGFESRMEAVNLCRKVRERGGVCFVRGTAGDAPIQWAKRATNEQFASR